MRGSALNSRFRKKFAHPLFRTPDQCHLAPHYHRSLQQFRVGDKNLDDRLRIVDVIGLVETELGEYRVLPYQVLDRVFELGHDVGKDFAAGFGLHVLNDVELDAQLLGDRQSIR